MIRRFTNVSAALSTFLGLALAAVLLTGCDSTPRDRQEVASKAGRELDTLTRTAAQKLARVGKARKEMARARMGKMADPTAAIARCKVKCTTKIMAVLSN